MQTTHTNTRGKGSAPETTDPLTPHEREAERIAAICEDFEHPEHADAYHRYCDTLRRALEHGRVWTPDRVRRLYAVAAEICDEIDEIERDEARFNAHFHGARSLASQLAGVMEDETVPSDARELIEKQIAELAARVGVTLATPDVLLSALPAIAEAAHDQGLTLDVLPMLRPALERFTRESEERRT
jgi:hypothetical protein